MKQNIKKLTLQYGYLSLEKNDVSDACTSVEKEMSDYMKKYFSEDAKSFYSEPEEIDQTKESKKNIDNTGSKNTKPKDIKKLYRKLASKIHPDKTDNEDEKKLFAEAAEAYESNDVGKLLEISGLVSLEIPELSDECVDILNGNILYLSKEIEDMKTTSAWSWYKAKNHEEKMSIIENVVNVIRRQQ